MLGPGYVVESSVGHIRDLPRNADEVPKSLKSLPWARLGVDVDNGFKPLYVVPKEKRQVVSKLKDAVRQADEVYLATDEDREGESIAWHLLEVLSPQVPVKRMVFHEITPAAIQRAVREWRELDRKLVDAQEARRILDRLYGYELSPVLWKKVMPRLSAGRVQSVACRMVVERERERMAFRPAAWWDIEGLFSADTSKDAANAQPPGERDAFKATLWSIDSIPVATGKDFDATGSNIAGNRVKLVDQQAAAGIAERLSGALFEVSSVTKKPYKRSPAAPFTTSTLQQEAGRKLRFSSKRTMQVAQRLYEQGWITYMRTDSTTLSDEAIQAARRQAETLYGATLVSPSPRLYKNKVKNAQEAHEAIRPAGENFRTIDEARRSLTGDELHLYELVWKRTIASQMIDATGTTTQAKLSAVDPGTGTPVVMAAAGTAITQMGFLKAYQESSDEQDEDRDQAGSGNLEGGGTDTGAGGGGTDTGAGGWLPPLEEGDQVMAISLESKSHTTQPPPRFTEASLVKALEEKGIGRPSTYASIISTIQDRGYAWKKGSALVPSFVAFAVVGLLEAHFPNLVDYGFTAAMEDELDNVAAGTEEAIPWLTRFYFGNGMPTATASTTVPSAGVTANGTPTPGQGLKYEVLSRLVAIDARKINEIPLGTDTSGNEVVVRVGRYGPYIQRGEDRASVPDNTCPDELTLDKALEILDTPATGNRVLGTDPETGLEISVRTGRYGPYVQLGDDDANDSKPKRASLFSSMSASDISLETASKLLSLPRVVGIDPESGEQIVAKNGRFGPYLEKGKDTRSLENEELLLSIDLAEALARLSMPKTRRGAQPAAPLREIGIDTNSNQQITLRTGRYGPYVTDGAVNASLRTGDDPETITADRAMELLAARRAALEDGAAAKPKKRTGATKTKKSSGTTKSRKAAG